MDLSRVTILRNAPLGAGAFGCVFKAFDAATGQYLAVKEGHGEIQSSAALSLAVEFETLSKLSHDNIVRVYGFDVEPNVVRMYLEWLPGGSLSSVARSLGGALHESALRGYFRDILRGLAYLHANRIVHRDVKPANMLLDAQGRVKLSDFGTRKALQATQAVASQTMSNGGVAGTPSYMDAASLQGKATPASDLWAAACSVVELASACAPWSELEIVEPLALMFHIAFLAQPPVHHPCIPEHLSPDLQSVLSLCFAHVPTDRPSAAELLQHRYFTGDEADVCRHFETQEAYQRRIASMREGASTAARKGSDSEDATLQTDVHASTATLGTLDASQPQTDVQKCARMLRGVENLPDCVEKFFESTVPSDCEEVREFLEFAAEDSLQLNRITLRSLSLIGRVNWSFLPNVKAVDLSGNSIDGQVDLVRGAIAFSALQSATLQSAWHQLDRLTHIHLQCNALSGAFNMSLLPPNLIELSLRSNNLTGPLQLAQLPPSLKAVDVSRNSFSGFAELRFLPPGLTELNLSYNNLSGTVDLTQLPRAIHFVHLNNNHFVGTVDVSFLPDEIKMVNLFSNRFGPPGRNDKYGSGIIGISARVLDYASKERIKGMNPARRADPELQTTPEDEAEIQEEMADAFPASLGSLLLSANAFKYPRDLSGMIRMGKCQVTL